MPYHLPPNQESGAGAERMDQQNRQQQGRQNQERQDQQQSQQQGRQQNQQPIQQQSQQPVQQQSQEQSQNVINTILTGTLTMPTPQSNMWIIDESSLNDVSLVDQIQAGQTILLEQNGQTQTMGIQSITSNTLFFTQSVPNQQVGSTINFSLETSVGEPVSLSNPAFSIKRINKFSFTGDGGNGTIILNIYRIDNGEQVYTEHVHAGNGEIISTTLDSDLNYRCEITFGESNVSFDDAILSNGNVNIIVDNGGGEIFITNILSDALFTIMISEDESEDLSKITDERQQNLFRGGAGGVY